MRRVLIVDSDLGFVFWLGQSLDAAGCETLPAKGISEAVSLLQELRVVIDVVIVRCSLEGAADFVADLRWSQGGHLKAIALIDQSDHETGSLPLWDGCQLKPHLPDENARKNFLKLVQGVLAISTGVR